MRRTRSWFKGLIIVSGCGLLFFGTRSLRHGSSDDAAKVADPSAPTAIREPSAVDKGSILAASHAHHAAKVSAKGDTAGVGTRSGAGNDEAPMQAMASTPNANDRKREVEYTRVEGDSPTDPTLCGSIEYRGPGPSGGEVNSHDWSLVMDGFHESKRQLLSWLETHQTGISPTVTARMDDQVRSTKIQRPPTADMPDLAWRGIGIYTHSVEEGPVIKLGGGFVNLMIQHPARGKFELTRLLAQNWGPCELRDNHVADAGRAVSATTSGADIWGGLVSCLGLNGVEVGEAACAPGSYSEAAWAVSSALASVISPPGCTVPAFSHRSPASLAGEGEHATGLNWSSPDACLAKMSSHSAHADSRATHAEVKQ